PLRACCAYPSSFPYTPHLLSPPFFFIATATTHLSTLSLHDALPILFRPAIAVTIPARRGPSVLLDAGANADARPEHLFQFAHMGDRKSTRLNSSHGSISYAVFCLKKKIKKKAHRWT